MLGRNRLIAPRSGLIFGVFLVTVTTANKTDVSVEPNIFSARDSYVWPSAGFPERDPMSDDPLDYERIATYPFFGHWADKTYRYIVCKSNYLSEGNRYIQWSALLMKAMERRELDTGVVIAEQLASTDCAEPLIFPVSDAWEYLYLKETEKNISQSEIRVLDDRDASAVLLAIPGLSKDLFNGCLIAKTTPACVTSPTYSDDSRLAGTAIKSADITFKQSVLENNTFDTPCSTQINRCFPPGKDYALYRIGLHEAGHALGMSGVNSPLWCQP